MKGTLAVFIYKCLLMRCAVEIVAKLCFRAVCDSFGHYLHLRLNLLSVEQTTTAKHTADCGKKPRPPPLPLQNYPIKRQNYNKSRQSSLGLQNRPIIKKNAL